MSIRGLLASLWRLCYAEMVVERPDYAALAQEVEAMAAQEAPRFHGEARDEVQLIFDELQADLELTDTIARRLPGGEIDRVLVNVRTTRGAIPDLQHYEINEKVIERFEAIAGELNAWAGELRARGYAPGGPASPPF